MEGSWDATEDRKRWEAERSIGGPTSELKPKTKDVVEEVLQFIAQQIIEDQMLYGRETPPQ